MGRQHAQGVITIEGGGEAIIRIINYNGFIIERMANIQIYFLGIASWEKGRIKKQIKEREK